MRWKNKNTCRWPVLLVISVPKIFLNGQFYFNLSSKTWSHVFFGTQCIYCIISPTADRVYDVSRFNSITPKTVATCANSCKISIARFLRDSRACHCGLYRYRIPKNASSGVWLSTAVNCWCIDTVIRHHHIPLSTSITPSLFHSRLKTYLFNKSFPPS